MTNALIVVDVQKDFVEGGSLGVEGGQKLAGILNSLVIPTWADNVGPILFTKDWHINPGTHFSETPDYVDSWPVHCKAETEGAEFAVDFGDVSPEHIFRKGMHSASYSGTDGVNVDGEGLIDYLYDIGVTDVTIVGIAFDYCVAATATELAAAGFDTLVVKHFTASVHPENDANVIETLEARGVRVHITPPFAGSTHA